VFANTAKENEKRMRNSTFALLSRSISRGHDFRGRISKWPVIYGWMY